jgi:hypothetical protein
MLKLRRLSGDRAKEVEVGETRGIWHEGCPEPSGTRSVACARACNPAIFALLHRRIYLACKTTSIQTGGAQILIQFGLNAHHQQLLLMFRLEFLGGCSTVQAALLYESAGAAGWAFIFPGRKGTGGDQNAPPDPI